MKKLLSPILIFILWLNSCSAPVLLLQPRDAAQDFNRMTVRLHPDGELFVGDQVSFEVIHMSDVQAPPNSITITLGGQVLGEGKFEPFGLGGRSQSTLYWVWDTSGKQPGEYSLTFIAQPGPVTWEEIITLHASDKVPPPEPDAHWESVEIPCCVIHYISGTDAEKQLETLKSVVSAQAASVEQRMSAKIEKKIPVTFLPRTLGHGGFASDGIYVSYLQNNYSGSTANQIIHHEMVHWLDRQLGGDFKPSILQEGLAVYLSDGHFKVEPILPRAAALLDLNWYVPLRQLTNSFYRSQHEVGYIQAAAFVSYLISSYGWQDFNQFYRNIQPVAGGSDADALDSALKQHFGVTLENMERDFIAYLRKQIVDETHLTDLRLTVAFYDTVRRYQLELDSSAYFLSAWLPNAETMRERGIVADYLRQPDDWHNRRLEKLLISADVSLRAGNYAAAEANIIFINQLLDVHNFVE